MTPPLVCGDSCVLFVCTLSMTGKSTLYKRRGHFILSIPKRQKEELFSGDLLQREEKTTFGVQRGEHGCGGLLFAGHLWMAVGALQKAGVTMTGQLRHRLLIDTAVQQGGDKKVPQGVQVIFRREAVGGVDFPQALGECIRMDDRPIRVDEQIGAELSAVPCRFLCQPPAITEQHTTQRGGENDLPTVTVFGTAFHDTPASHDAAGAAGGEDESVAAGVEVRPAQSAQLAAATAGSHGQQIEHAEVPWLSGEGLQQRILREREVLVRVLTTRIPSCSSTAAYFTSRLDSTLGVSFSPVCASSRALSSVAVPSKLPSVCKNAERESASGSTWMCSASTGAVSVQTKLALSNFSDSSMCSMSRPVQAGVASLQPRLCASSTKLLSAAPLMPVVPEILSIGSSACCFRV